MNESLELLVRREDERVVLACPEVGRFTCAVPQGQALVAGQRAGVLLHLGRSVELRVPDGVYGTVASQPPEAVRAPVSVGDALYSLVALEGSTASIADEDAGASAEGAMVSPQAGRFYRKPSPNEADFVQVGDVIEAGAAVGLIEVMKTFAQVPYAAEGGLPAKARVVEFLVEDGDDVDRGMPILRVEPA